VTRGCWRRCATLPGATRIFAEGGFDLQDQGHGWWCAWGRRVVFSWIWLDGGGRGMGRIGRIGRMRRRGRMRWGAGQTVRTIHAAGHPPAPQAKGPPEQDDRTTDHRTRLSPHPVPPCGTTLSGAHGRRTGRGVGTSHPHPAVGQTAGSDRASVG
jgi:hypothetical protein